jgi:hypothetical protein
VGYASLAANTTGSHQTASGFEALATVATTSFNTAYGSQALKVAVADSCVAVGAQSLVACTSGAGNTAVGRDSMGATTTGSNNVAVGKSALYANTTGAQNTCVGSGSGDSITTGSNNTFLGYNTGTALTTGSNMLFIGVDAGNSGSPGGNWVGQSNAIVLGDENVTDCYIQADWNIASDQRDKTDFTALDLGLDFVKALAPVTYKWDKRSKYGDKTAPDYDLLAQTPDGTHKEDWLDIGFKAQEVEALEIAAGYDKDNKTNLTTSHGADGKQMSLQYSKFVPILVKAIQEQNALIEALTARITTLEG